MRTKLGETPNKTMPLSLSSCNLRRADRPLQCEDARQRQRRWSCRRWRRQRRLQAAAGRVVVPSTVPFRAFPLSAWAPRPMTTAENHRRPCSMPVATAAAPLPGRPLPRPHAANRTGGPPRLFTASSRGPPLPPVACTAPPSYGLPAAPCGDGVVYRWSTSGAGSATPTPSSAAAASRSPRRASTRA